jgi:hypothetical protein
MHHIQRRHHPPQSLLLSHPHMRPRMRHQIRNPQQLAPPQLLDKQLHRLSPKDFIRRRQVDQITVMTHRLRIIQPRMVSLPVLNHLILQRLALPLLLILRKNLHRLHAEFLSRQQGIVQSAGDGEMRSKHVAEF